MRYAFVVSACKKYVPELCALLNSLDQIGNVHPVHVIGYELPQEFVDQFPKLGYMVKFYNVPEAEARQFGGESEILCRKRYWYAAEWGKEYDAICILDADMVIVRNLDNFFEIAAKTDQILGVTLEQKTTYGTDEDSHFHQRVLGEHLVKAPIWNTKDMCCTPCFVNAKTYEAQLKKSWDIFTWGFPDNNFKAPDQQAFNMLLVAEGLTDKVTLLPNMCWVGSNEKLLKPYTRVTRQQDGNLWTESGEPIYVLHGGFYTKKWRDQQLINRHGCALGYLGFADNCDRMAVGAMETLYGQFKKALSGPIKINDTKEYKTDGYPDKTYADEGRTLV